MYTTHTGCSKKRRLKQYQQHIYLGQLQKWKNIASTGSTATSSDTNILSTQVSYMNQIMRDMIQIDLHPKMKEKDGFILNVTWKPFLHHTKEQRKYPHRLHRSSSMALFMTNRSRLSLCLMFFSCLSLLFLFNLSLVSSSSNWISWLAPLFHCFIPLSLPPRGSTHDSACLTTHPILLTYNEHCLIQSFLL